MTSDNPATNESVTRSHLRGSVLLVSGRVLALLINFAVQVFTVRYLGKADFGLFAFAISVATLASVCCALSMDKVVSRFVPVYLHDHDYAKFWGVLSTTLFTVLAMGFAVVVVFFLMWWVNLTWLTDDRRALAVLAIVACLAAFNALDALLISLFAVLASPAAIFWRRHMLGPLFRLIAAVAVALAGGGLFAFAAGQVIASLLGLCICLVLLFRILAKHDDLRGTLRGQRLSFPVRDIYSFSATLLAGDLSFLLRSSLVPIVIGLWFMSEEVAAYQAVLPLARLNEVVLMTFSILFLPSAAKLAAAKRHTELQTLFENTTTWITLLSLPIFAVSIMGAEILPVLLFGNQYANSSTILAWLAVGYFANASLGTSLRLLRAMGKLRTLLAIDLVLILVAVTLVGSLVPRYGALGGAWAVCATYLIQSVLYYAMVAQHTPVNPLAWRSLAPFATGVTCCVAGAGIRSALNLPPLVGLLGAVLFCLIMFVLFRRQLQLSETFPELIRLPLIGRWLGPMPVGSNS